MQTLTDPGQLQAHCAQGASLLLFGGSHCSVCQVIRPRLEQQFGERFPLLKLAYVDCEAAAGVCARYAVFSVPVVQVYFEGSRFIERVRVFSLGQLAEDIQRPYDLWMDAQ